MNHLEFKDIISHVAALYRKGVLVPFIGSGVSYPFCADWRRFVINLVTEAELETPSAPKSGDSVEANELYRMADKAVMALKAFNLANRADKYRRALKADATEPVCTPEIPIQTKALSKLFWPLVLTTNYDDLYWSAATADNGNKDLKRKKPQPEVLGRSLDDCHQVLRSLDEDPNPILWALQGFIGG